MNKFVTEKRELLEIFSKVIECKAEDVSPILDKALYNFKEEMRAPLEHFETGVPLSMRAEIFNIFLKHFKVSMLNCDSIMRNKNINIIREKIDKLAL